MSTKIQTLTRPVTFDGKPYDSLALREPKAGEMCDAEKQAERYGFMLALISKVADIPIGAVDLMGQRDTDLTEEYLSDFIQADEGDPPESEAEMVLHLTTPVTLGQDITYTELNLREPLNAERRKASQAGLSFAVAISQISIVAKVPVSVVRGMTATDFMQAMRYFQGFSPRRRATGRS